MREEFNHTADRRRGFWLRSWPAAVTDGDRKVLLLEAGFSHYHPLLDTPPGIVKLISGSNT